MTDVTKMLKDRAATPEQALSFFDALEPTTLDFMRGHWRGFEIATGHPMDGLLSPSGWYGKLFAGRDEVHPLLFYSRDRSSLYAVNPALLPLSLPIPRSLPIGLLMWLSRPLLQTKRPRARMRLVEYRGRATGTMIYDAKPICDHFVKVNENTMLGVMDLKGVPAPYVFVLERDNTPLNVAL